MNNYPPIPVPGRRLVRADIVIPDLHLVVEYDGVRFHAELEQRDRAQTAALEAAGWTVLRVREIPLFGLGGNEVFVLPTQPIKSVALKVLGALEKMGHVADHLADYRSDPHPWAETAAKKAIHKHRAVSLASEYPTLAEEFDAAKNDGVRPDQVHPPSHTRFVWTCRECANEWYSTPALRAAGHGCPKCGYRRVAQKLSQARPGESAVRCPTAQFRQFAVLAVAGRWPISPGGRSARPSPFILEIVGIVVGGQRPWPHNRHLAAVVASSS